MIIKNRFQEKIDILEEESEGIRKAVSNLDKRYKNNEIERDKFLKQAKAFAKQHEAIKKLQNKTNTKH